MKNLLHLKGSLKTNKKPLSNKELDEVVAQAVADEYAQKLKRMRIFDKNLQKFSK